MIFDSIIFSYASKKILGGIYLKIPKGKIVGLYGLNGSGKSTLLKIGCGYLKQDDGNIFINQESCYEKSLVSRFEKIAYLSQDSFLPSDLTIKEIVTRNNFSKKAFVDDSLIGPFFFNKINSLSGGELRYLEIKLIFELNREYYLLDEPFSGIEPIMIEKIISLILNEKSKNKGILITDHFYRYIKEINDISYILRNGLCYEINKDNLDKELFNFGYKPHV
ncbi:MAG: ATP-binding cassette domain-containing protein [Ignavibacteriae bacterium]|nr:ATP-binding cassette domain-containing protein [Ignavibacteriota bacterium]